MRSPFLLQLGAVCLFVSGCGDSSDSSTDGPDDDGSCVVESTLSLEDSKAFFPFRPGNRWAYRGSIDRGGGTPTEYATELVALELENRGGAMVQPLRVTNPRNSREPGTQYFSLSDSGMTNEGNDVADDRLTPEVVPYPEVTFPVQLCSTFEQFNVTIDSGRDVDGDQQNEPLTVVSRVWLRRLEDVETPIGTFPQALRLERSTTATATGTRTGQSAETTEQSIEWFAKDVGPVKRTLTTETETVEEAVYGFGVDGAGRGAALLEPLAVGVASAGSDQTSPGRPAIASDGNRFLVVFANAASTASLEAVFLSNTGAVESTLSLGEAGTTPAAAYDGQNYLVVFRSDAGIGGVRLSPEGTKLGSTITVATATNVIEPDVAFGGGAFLVAYGRYTGTEWNLYGTRVSSEGVAEAEFVLSDAPRDQRAPALSFDGAGFLAAWQDARNDADIGRNTDIYAARITPDGRVIDASAIAVSTGAAPETDVDVASHGEHFVLAWYASRNPSFIGDGEIRAAQVGADGTLLNGAATAGGFAINTTERSKGHPRVARFGEGALVVWDSQDFSTAAAGILGVRVDASGTLLDGSPADEGLWLSRVPSPSIATRFVLPELASLGDRLLLAFIDNVETSGETKSVQASLLYPW